MCVCVCAGAAVACRSGLAAKRPQYARLHKTRACRLPRCRRGRRPVKTAESWWCRPLSRRVALRRSPYLVVLTSLGLLCSTLVRLCFVRVRFSVSHIPSSVHKRVSSARPTRGMADSASPRFKFQYTNSTRGRRRASGYGCVAPATAQNRSSVDICDIRVFEARSGLCVWTRSNLDALREPAAAVAARNP